MEEGFIIIQAQKDMPPHPLLTDKKLNPLQRVEIKSLLLGTTEVSVSTGLSFRCGCVAKDFVAIGSGLGRRTCMPIPETGGPGGEGGLCLVGSDVDCIRNHTVRTAPTQRLFE
jgi:hypothetical protein